MNHTLAELIDKRLSRWFRSDRKRPPRFLAGLKQSVRANPSKTVRELAKNSDIRRINASRAVRNVLGMKSFVRRRRNIYTARSREIQAKKCPLLLNHLKNRRGHVKVSVDGKKFTVKEVTNRQLQATSLHTSGVPEGMQSRNLSTVLVFGAVPS